MLLIKNGYIRPITAPELKNGCVLIGDDGKIKEIAEHIDAPAGAQIIDAEGRLVTPGCVDAHCHVGIYAVTNKNSDLNESSENLTPQMRVIDGIDPFDDGFVEAREGGITSGCVSPGSSNTLCGTAAAIKFTGKRIDDMIIKYPVAMKCAFGENPKSKKRMPVTRMGIAATLREMLFKAKRYAEDKDAGKNPSFDMKLEALEPVIRGELPLKCHAHRADDIFTAIRIAKEFNLKLTLDHVTDGSLIADELAKENYPVIVGPSMGRRHKQEIDNKNYKTAGDLYRAGLPVSITTDAPVVSIQYLPMCAGLCVADGLPFEEAWRAITINPATTLGIENRVGSLEVGKDGDVVIWTADPVACVGGAAYTTIIDGKVVYQA